MPEKNKNHFLKLLESKVSELDELVSDANEKNLPFEYKKYLICGYITMLDSLLETGIGDLHSVDLSELTTLIYYTRQKAIHYGYFNGLGGVESIFSDIKRLINSNYDSEQEFFGRMIKLPELDCVNNIVIKYNSNIINDKIFYKFIDKSGNTLLIPNSHIFSLTKQNKEKILSLIIDFNFDTVPLYIKKDDDNESSFEYKEIDSEEAKSFLQDNFIVISENYKDHQLVMNNIIDDFVNNPEKSIQIMEYSSNEQFCRNTIDVIRDFVVNNTMYDNYIYSHYLIKDKYSLKKIIAPDYKLITFPIKKSILEKMDYKDAFFINLTIKQYNEFERILNDFESVPPQSLAIMLIQLFETGPKFFSNEFVSFTAETKKCFNNLQRYRQLFSHYYLDNEEYKKGVAKFKEEFDNYIIFLSSFNLEAVKRKPKELLQDYLLIERDRNDFFNYKHEQYLKISDSDYIGNKILYSSSNPKTQSSLIAIIQGGRSAGITNYYQRNEYGFIVEKYSSDKKNPKSIETVADTPLLDAKSVKADLSLSTLFEAYMSLNNLKSNGAITISFEACEENGNYEHKDDLQTIILRAYSLGYYPIELLKHFTVDYTNLKKGYLEILDDSGKQIAIVVNERKCNFIKEYPKDKKGFFSRVDNITHDFNERRHAR